MRAWIVPALVRRAAWAVVSCVTLTTAAAGVFLLVVPPTYTAVAEVEISVQPEDDTTEAISRGVSAARLLAAQAAAYAETDAFARGTWLAVGEPGSSGSRVAAVVPAGTSIVRIRVGAHRADTADALIGAATAEIADHMSGETVFARVLAPSPSVHNSPQVGQTFAVAILLGLGLGTITAWALIVFSRRVLLPSDVRRLTSAPWVAAVRADTEPGGAGEAAALIAAATGQADAGVALVSPADADNARRLASALVRDGLAASPDVRTPREASQDRATPSVLVVRQDATPKAELIQTTTLLGAAGSRIIGALLVTPAHGGKPAAQ